MCNFILQDEILLLLFNSVKVLESPRISLKALEKSWDFDAKCNGTSEKSP